MMRAQRNEDISQHINYVRTIGELFGPATVQTIVNPRKFSEKLAPWYEVDPAILMSEEKAQELAQQTGEMAGQGGASAGDMMSTIKELMP